MIRNHPVDAEGNPFPTLYWLTCTEAVAAVSRLESEGWIKRLSQRAEVEPDFRIALRRAHEEYANERDRLHPGAKAVPYMTVGATDARFFRRLGIPSYGFGLFSTRITFDDFASMFHGDNERVDVDSLELTTQLWEAVIDDFLL